MKTRIHSDEARWKAVRQRNPRADRAFYYAVKTTGIYCRPTCPSRRPKRENVQFFASPAAAEHAGFRPCRRCHPNVANPVHDPAKAIAHACREIESAENAPALDQLAATAGLSRFHFQRLFKRTVGLTPKEYALARRAERTRRELPRSRTVTEAIYRAGFNSSGRFYAESNGALGMAPKKFRAGGDGLSIHYALGRCSLGRLLVAATDKGVCLISLGDETQPLIADLHRRFPRAQILAGGKSFAQTVAAVIRLVEEPGLGLNLPLDIQGTAFQRRVWQALREIPLGQTASYADIARKIGAPKSTRAVAGACGANHLAVVIPCHRVVHSDGTLSGYHWGVARKRALLQREKSPKPK